MKNFCFTPHYKKCFYSSRTIEFDVLYLDTWMMLAVMVWLKIVNWQISEKMLGIWSKNCCVWFLLVLLPIIFKAIMCYNYYECFIQWHCWNKINRPTGSVITSSDHFTFLLVTQRRFYIYSIPVAYFYCIRIFTRH